MAEDWNPEGHRKLKRDKLIAMFVIGVLSSTTAMWIWSILI